MDDELEQRVLACLDRLMTNRTAPIGLDDRFAEDLGLDSFTAMELIFEAEDEFGLDLPESEARALKTPRDLAALVRAIREKEGGHGA